MDGRTQRGSHQNQHPPILPQNIRGKSVQSIDLDNVRHKHYMDSRVFLGKFL